MAIERPTRPRSEAARRGVLGYETKDANVRAIWGAVLILAAIMIAIHVGLWGYMKNLQHGSAPQDKWAKEMAGSSAAISKPGVPKLQVSPPADLQKFRAQEDVELNTYGWIDKQRGIARIPIERAMEILAGETNAMPNQRTHNK